MQENKPSLDEQRATVDALFEDPAVFESELFMVQDQTGLREVMQTAAKAVLDRPRGQATINFATLKSYEQFRIEGCVLALKELMDEELDYLIRQEAGFDDIVADEVRGDSKKQAFMITRAKTYFLNFQSLFKAAIADTFFQRIESAAEMTAIDKIVQEVIDGVSRYAPVLVQNGVPLARKGDQIWMRLKQARAAKEKELAAAQEDVSRLTRQLRGIELNLTAIEKARALTLADLENMGPDQMKEAVINEDGSLTEKKRLMQFLPAGELALYAADQMDRGRRNGRNDIQKAEYKRATAFYENCNINNTAKELDSKTGLLKAELPQKKEALERAEKKLAALEHKGLEQFDESLLKIRNAFIENIGKTRL
ncbi:MAG: hypothetical protein AB7E49_09330 [Campylobacterales bacterium]